MYHSMSIHRSRKKSGARSWERLLRRRSLLLILLLASGLFSFSSASPGVRADSQLPNEISKQGGDIQTITLGNHPEGENPDKSQSPSGGSETSAPTEGSATTENSSPSESAPPTEGESASATDAPEPGESSATEAPGPGENSAPDSQPSESEAPGGNLPSEAENSLESEPDSEIEATFPDGVEDAEASPAVPAPGEMDEEAKRLARPFPKRKSQLSLLIPESEPLDTVEGETGALSEDPNWGSYLPDLLHAGYPDFNPLLPRSPLEGLLSSLLYRPLWSEDSDLRLLSSYEFSENGEELLLTLKEGLHWSDAEILSSRDLEFSLLALLKKDLANPGKSFTRFLKGYTQLSAREDFTQPRLGEKPAPYVDKLGIVSLDDRNLKLIFIRDMRPFAQHILSLRPLPAHCWWEESPLFWEELERPAASLFRGNGPYFLSRLVKGEDLELSVTPKADGKAPASAEVFPEMPWQKLLLRPVPDEAEIDLLLETKADAALLKKLSAADRERLTGASYELYQLPLNEGLCMKAARDEMSHPFGGPHGQEALRLLLPDLASFQAEGGEYFTGNRAPKNVEASLLDLTQEERQTRAFELLLEDGWICPALSPDSLSAWQKDHPEQELRSVTAMGIAYDPEDPALAFVASLIQTAMTEAKLPLEIMGLHWENGETLPAYVMYTLTRSPLNEASEKLHYPLFQTNLQIAVKKEAAAPLIQFLNRLYAGSEAGVGVNFHEILETGSVG